MLSALKKRLRIDFSKNTKFVYYLSQISKMMLPDLLYRRRLDRLLERAEADKSILERLAYYNKITSPFPVPDHAKTLGEFRKTEKKKTYFFDLFEYWRYFDSRLKLSYLFGDITIIPEAPALLKSRPIDGDNRNAILFKLNKVRHFIFVNDTIPFEAKKDMAVWRGKAYREHRKRFVQAYCHHPLCDIGQTNTKYDTDVPWQKPKLSLREQLKYKFIIAIEGNDVASNLKWVMSSNSLAMMARPTYETWFMEGTLIPDHHYVLLKDDYSDLEVKIRYYTEHSEEAKRIVANANAFVEQFQDREKEDLISLLVLKKFFQDSGQISS
jgi:hypothetical protein